MPTKHLYHPLANRPQRFSFLTGLLVSIGVFLSVYLLVYISTHLMAVIEKSQEVAAHLLVDTSNDQILPSLDALASDVEGEEEFYFSWYAPPRVYTRILQPAGVNTNGVARRKTWLGISIQDHQPGDHFPRLYFRIIREGGRDDLKKMPVTTEPDFRLEDLSAFSAALAKFAEWERVAKEHVLRVEDKLLFESPALLAYFSMEENDPHARLKIVLIRSYASRETLVFDSENVSRLIRLCEGGPWRKAYMDAEKALQSQEEQKRKVEYLLK